MCLFVIFVIIAGVTERCDIMSLIPNTTCRRCHRQYPSFRGRCPYCGTKKAREVRSAVPETDSAVPGTEASKSAAEAINWQMLIGGVLLVAMFIVTILLVSMNVSKHVEKTTAENPTQQQPSTGTFTTAPPTFTPEPTASPTPPPAITSVSIGWAGRPNHDYNGDGFYGRTGEEYDMDVTYYPLDIEADIVWKSSNENAVTVDQDGVVKLVGSGESTITVDINGKQEASFNVVVN